MSKELEYIQRQINIVKQQVKGSKVKIIVTDTVTKYRYDYYERELQTLENIEQALDRLEAIDNANTNEALKALKELRVIANTYCSFNGTQCEHNKELADIIEKALLKAQEPKHYLKWEDLKFKEETQKMNVKMGDNIYYIEWFNRNYKVVNFYTNLDDNTLHYTSYVSEEHKQFFNDLHLEAIEE